MKIIRLSLIFLATLVLLRLPASPVFGEEPKILNYEVIKTLDHKRNSFTQGLISDGDYLVESSGLYRRSYIMKYHKLSGEVLRSTKLPPNIFAEGLTKIDQYYYLLTWKKGQLLILNEQFEIIKKEAFSGQGWGLSHNDKYFIMTDGSDTLQFRDLKSFELIKTKKVKGGDRHWKNLNEIEYVNGYLLANMWFSNEIAIIHVKSGKVVALLDLSPLKKANLAFNRDAALNGIAYDKTYDAFWVTGKLWPKRYLIKVPELKQFKH